MGFSKVTINRGQGGLGRPVPGEDHISAFIVLDHAADYLATVPGAKLITTTNAKGVIIRSLAEAESYGIVENGATTGLLWKHLSDFYTLAPGAELHLFVPLIAAQEDPTDAGYATSVTNILQQIVDNSNGKIRQAAVLTASANYVGSYEATLFSALNTKLEALETANTPLILAINGEIANQESPGTITDLTQQSYERIVAVSASFNSLDALGTGANLGAQRCPIGAVLGAIAGVAVHESIAWPERVNLADLGYTESYHSLADAEAATNKAWVDLVSYTGLGGIYFSKSTTAIVQTSDYARIENVRVLDKAARNIRTLLLPKLNSPLYADPSSGELGEETIAYFKGLARRAVESLEVAGEISGFAVTIDPSQNVLSTSTLTVSVAIVPVGSAEEIVVNLSYTLSTN